MLARLGGDEFAIIVKSAKSRSVLELLASRLIDVVAQSYEIDGHRIRSSISIGIAVGPRDGANAEHLLMAARSIRSLSCLELPPSRFRTSPRLRARTAHRA